MNYLQTNFWGMFALVILPVALFTSESNGQEPIFHLNFSADTITDVSGNQTIDVGSDVLRVAGGGPTIGGVMVDSGEFPNLDVDNDNTPGSILISQSSTMDGIAIGDGSYVGWVKPDAGETRAFFFSTSNLDRPRGLEVIADPQGDVNGAIQGWSFNDGGSGKVYGTDGNDNTVDMPEDIWTHIAMTWTASGAFTLYIDGTAGSPGNFGNFGLNLDGVDPLTWNIGADRNANFKAWPGQFADVAFYDAELTSTEIADIIANGVSTGSPGDFDSDGDVDGNDFLVWQRGGSPNGATAGDLVEWENHYGDGAAVQAFSAISVPEPASMLMLLLGSCSLVAMRRRLL